MSPKNQIKYRYYLRPAYGSDKLLIEFLNDTGSEQFIDALFNAIHLIQPVMEGEYELWMNDEVIFKVNSALGRFEISKDVWDLVFIMAHHNQPCVTGISALLNADKRFEKVEVDFSAYK
jgi:hypothetical protein